MTREERRKARRVSLRLPLAVSRALERQEHWAGIWTRDVSAGGMFFHLPPERAPQIGEELSFQLAVPPGAGYSASAGKIAGSGRVVRAVPLPGSKVGVALCFTQSLSLDFPH